MSAFVILLSRLQFAFTIMFHFVMVPLSIGLIFLVVVFETMYFKTRDDKYKKQANFWGNLFAINFIVGIVTGITMEIQFGTNWAEYSKFMGDVFGSPLAIEALVAFFLESTFAGIWIFYRHKISAKLRLISAVMILIGTHISAVWIITANGFMQNPVGYEMSWDGSEVILTDFTALALNPYALFMLLHTVTSAYLLSSFFMLGVSGYHLFRKQHIEFFKRSAKLGLVVLALSSLSQPLVGHFYAQYIATVQPAKAATFEAIWETESSVPLYLVQIPIPSQEKNINLFPIPYAGSYMYTNTPTGEVKGIKEVTKNWSPEMYNSFKSIVPLVHYSFRTMAGLGMIFIALAFVGCYLFWKGKYADNKWINLAFLLLIPTPWIAIMLGWVVAEVGRQPWIVNGLMLTSDAVSKNVSAPQVIFSFVTLCVFYGILFVVELYMIGKFIMIGPLDNPFKSRG